LLFTKGLAQKPILKINARLINKTLMPSLSPKRSPNPPMMNGNMAPPTIPVTRIPEKDPWCSLTEFKAKEKMIG